MKLSQLLGYMLYSGPGKKGGKAAELDPVMRE